MRCLYCQKEVESMRGTKKFCNGNCRQSYARKGDSVTKIVPVSVTKDNSVTVSVTYPDAKKLIFTNEPLEKRIKMYKDMFPDSSFVPNWVAHGFNSQLEAMDYAIKKVRDNPATHNLGLGND